jgi:hypothetical protein
MSEYSLVLSDELLKLYTDFTKGERVDKVLLAKFLRYYHGPHITSTKQYFSVIEQDPQLLRQLSGQDGVVTDEELAFDDASLLGQLSGQDDLDKEDDVDEELYKKTKYKIILNTKKSEYPYVNINGDSVEKNFSLTFKKNENRDKLKSLLKALCENAKQIWIFDKYLIKDDTNQTNLKNLLKEILPKKQLKINFCNYFDNNGNSKPHKRDPNLGYKNITTELSRHCNDWKMPPTIVSDPTYRNLHDRYLRIEAANSEKIEIILSSGFFYVLDDTKDISALIREV